MEGNLNKWINLVHRWQLRYFILNDDILVYCDQKGGPTKGQIHLKISAIIMVLEDPLRFIINTGTSELQVRASNVAEKINWVNALKRAQEQSLQDSGQYVQDGRTPKQQSQGQRINDCLADIWVTQAQFDETMSLLKPKLEKNSNVRELAQRLEVLGRNLKNKITLCTKMLENQQKMVNGSDFNGSPPVNDFVIENEDAVQQQNFQQEDFQEDGTIFESFGDNNSELLNGHDEVRHEQKYSEDRRLLKKETVIQSYSMNSLLENIKTQQPIKYKNLFNNQAFMNLKLTNNKGRIRLPRTQDPKEKLNLWGIVKNMIGKDLTKITVPVELNEPLSMLQRFAETIEYQEYLQVASKEQDSCLRMCYIMGFGVSGYSSTIGRLKKPFNPILGETYELIHKDFKFMSEQVSHHPPITAGYVDSPEYESWGNTALYSTFRGKSIEFKPIGSTHVVLKKFKDHFTYNKCLTLVKNIIFGELYLDNAGIMNFKNHSTKDSGDLNLSERGWGNKGAYEMNGTVNDGQGNPKYTLVGRWDDKLVATNIATRVETVVWQRHKLPPNHENYYFFTDFTYQLNHLTTDMIKMLPCTDCRLRPDQQALEWGFLQIATEEKSRLEDKQRLRRKQMQISGQNHSPRYFDEIIDPLTQEQMYAFNQTYWEQKPYIEEGLDLF